MITPAGSVRYRLAADGSGYANLVLAGDWVKTALDAGCVEAAVMSGMQASRAICGVPSEIFGEDQGWLGGAGVSAGLAGYVEYGGLATCPSPVDCDDATLYSLFLEADHECLVRLCDKVFAAPSNGRVAVRPLGSHVMLSFGAVEKIKPRLEPWSKMGFAREEQAAIWVPVVVHRGDGLLPSLGWFVPYMFVEQPALAGGRARDLWVQQEPGPDRAARRGRRGSAQGARVRGQLRGRRPCRVESLDRGHPYRARTVPDAVEDLDSVRRTWRSLLDLVTLAGPGSGATCSSATSCACRDRRSSS